MLVKDSPSPEGIAGPGDFNHHISYEDAIQAQTVSEDATGNCPGGPGWHRIFAAKEVGLEKVPAHVAERVPHN